MKEKKEKRLVNENGSENDFSITIINKVCLNVDMFATSFLSPWTRVKWGENKEKGGVDEDDNNPNYKDNVNIQWQKSTLISMGTKQFLPKKKEEHSYKA